MATWGPTRSLLAEGEYEDVVAHLLPATLEQFFMILAPRGARGLRGPYCVVGANLGEVDCRSAWRRWPISCSPLRRCGGPS